MICLIVIYSMDACNGVMITKRFQLIIYLPFIPIITVWIQHEQLCFRAYILITLCTNARVNKNNYYYAQLSTLSTPIHKMQSPLQSIVRFYCNLGISQMQNVSHKCHWSSVPPLLVCSIVHYNLNCVDIAPV